MGTARSAARTWGREPVGVGIHRDRLQPFLVAGADDSQRDFAPVGDEDPAEL